MGHYSCQVCGMPSLAGINIRFQEPELILESCAQKWCMLRLYWRFCRELWRRRKTSPHRTSAN